MKIAIIGQKGIPVIAGGVERHVDDLSRQLVKLGHEVYVYTRWNYSDRRAQEYEGVRLINLPSIPTKHLDAISHTLLAIFDLMRRPVDVVHFHSIGPSALIWLARILKPNTPIVATFHSQCYHHRKWKFPARAALRAAEMLCCFFADKVIAINRNLADYASHRYNINPVYIPNGVLLPKAYGSDNIRERWGLEPNSYILSMGRLIAHKGIHYLIEAFKQIDTDKKLAIVGDGFFTDSYVQELKQMALDDKRIIFTGVQSGEVAQELYAHAYAFVQPSESEGLSIAMLEAMSYQKPMIVSDIPENRVAIEGAGVLFVNRCVSDLKNKLEALIKNPDQAAILGARARQRVEDRYNWEVIARDVEFVYKYTHNLYKRELFKRLYRRLKGSHLFARKVL